MTAAKNKLTVASDLIYASYDKPCCLHCKNVLYLHSTYAGEKIKADVFVVAGSVLFQ